MQAFARPLPLLALLLCTSGAGALAHGQLLIRIERVPAGTTASDTIYVAGSFNNWNPAASGFQLRKVGPAYTVTFPAEIQGPIEFKFTLGSWERVETDAAGGDVANRNFTIAPGSLFYSATVAGWRRGAAPARPSTRTPSVSVLDTAFPLPQLQRTRRVWLYLPPDYATSNKRYPVLYMHDGQNVFDAATSYAGEWGVDEALDSLQAAGAWGAIVVAVDHAGPGRVVEYSPWPTRFGPGEAEAYVEFLVRTLKPWIDARYRTKSDRRHTGIAGSSMGGLVSFYAALKYPEVFGRAAVFSPAFWIAPAAYDFAAHSKPLPHTRIYIVSGGREVAAGEPSGVYQRDQERMIATLAAAGFKGSEIFATIVPDGAHSEWFWRREFPAVYRFLFESR